MNTLTEAPRIEGKIEIVASVNDRIHWSDPNALVITIPSGEYWISDLLALVQQYMSNESISIGSGQQYQVALDQETGNFTIEELNSQSFFLNISVSETRKLLTGGDPSVGESGLYHLGFEVDNGLIGPGPIISPLAISLTWHPNFMTKKDTLDIHKSNVGEVLLLGGGSIARNFSGPNPPNYRELGFDLILQVHREQWFYFHRIYASQGLPFRYYKPRSSLSHDGEYQLTGNSLDDPSFVARRVQKPWFEGSFKMIKVG